LVTHDPTEAGVDAGLAERGEAELLVEVQKPVGEQK
jgi:hypothetical protein